MKRKLSNTSFLGFYNIYLELVKTTFHAASAHVSMCVVSSW